MRRRGGARGRVRARRVCHRMADDGLLEAVRGLHLAHPELGPKPLLAKLRDTKMYRGHMATNRRIPKRRWGGYLLPL